ncbi:uncharacterized protein IUM83_01369 [Phytophthora cinnamomi]|uniref:uncharacterized protein n=1 Tax=Phytophthora cinnamomi TaxID=4785 RepID=UPI00355A69A1|nr:hypothetical protein IUM83_01369 [Phytophthora cinnamomi]
MSFDGLRFLTVFVLANMSRRPAFDFASPPRDRQQLLAKRITTVEDLRCEVLERWNNKSSVQAFREIPVPLHCGETLQEYSKEFEMWLLQRNETFETLRNDPSRERGFWFSFAHKRAGTCNTVTLRNKTGGDTGAWAQEGVAEAGSAQCGVATVRCLLDADTLAPKERPRRRQYRSHFRRLTANVSPSARQTPASSQPAATKPSAVASPGTVFLSTRMLAVEEFRQERLIRSRLEHPPPPPSEAIPVPLYPETVEQYNHKFEQWLADRHESLESLHCNAKRERKLRLLMWNRTGLADARFHKKGSV